MQTNQHTIFHNSLFCSYAVDPYDCIYQQMLWSEVQCCGTLLLRHAIYLRIWRIRIHNWARVIHEYMCICVYVYIGWRYRVSVLRLVRGSDSYIGSVCTCVCVCVCRVIAREAIGSIQISAIVIDLISYTPVECPWDVR